MPGIHINLDRGRSHGNEFEATFALDGTAVLSPHRQHLIFTI